MLKIQNIHKSFGEQKVLDGMSFELEQGKVYTLVGGNGSGKITLFNIITGFLKPDAGIIEYKGQRLNHKSPVEIIKLGIARTFQNLRKIKNISVRENILLASGRKHSTSICKEFINLHKEHYKKADEIIEQVSLLEEKDSLTHEISYGQQKLLTMELIKKTSNRFIFLNTSWDMVIDNYKSFKVYEVVM